MADFEDALQKQLEVLKAGLLQAPWDYSIVFISRSIYTSINLI